MATEQDYWNEMYAAACERLDLKREPSIARAVAFAK